MNIIELAEKATLSEIHAELSKPRNRAECSRLVGCAKSTITRAVDSYRLFPESDGQIILSRPLNQHFLFEHFHGKAFSQIHTTPFEESQRYLTAMTIIMQLSRYDKTSWCSFFPAPRFYRWGFFSSNGGFMKIMKNNGKIICQPTCQLSCCVQRFKKWQNLKVGGLPVDIRVFPPSTF